MPIVPNARINNGAVFAFEQLTTGHWGWLAGARVDFRKLESDPLRPLNPARLQAGAGESRNYTDVSGDFGAVFNATENVAFTANVGRAFRAPTLFELLANGPQLGEQRFVIGDATMKSEHGLGLDGGLRIKAGSVRGEVSVYYDRFKNFIFLSPTADSVENLRVYRYEQSNARMYGFEAGAQVEAAKALTLRGQFDLTRGDDLDSKDPLPLIPPARGRFEAELHSASLSWAEYAHIGGEVEITSKKTNLSSQDVDEGLAGYTLLNFDAGIEKKVGGRSCELDLRVHNAANTRYTSFLSRYKEFALNEGRSIIARLSTGL